MQDIIAWSALLPALAAYLFNDSGGRGRKAVGVARGGWSTEEVWLDCEVTLIA